MKARLLKFFAEVRNANPKIIWTFSLVTSKYEIWTESMLVKNGMPIGVTASIAVEAIYPIRGRWTSGFLTANRNLSPCKIARNIEIEVRNLIDDVMREFRGRIADFQ